jgi:ABC-type phosphate transport system substrate-binding protein
MSFIEWILTDGQQYLSDAGYVQLPADQLMRTSKIK